MVGVLPTYGARRPFLCKIYNVVLFLKYHVFHNENICMSRIRGVFGYVLVSKSFIHWLSRYEHEFLGWASCPTLPYLCALPSVSSKRRGSYSPAKRPYRIHHPHYWRNPNLWNSEDLISTQGGWAEEQVHHSVAWPRWLNKSPNLGNVSHKQGGIAETVKKCNGELGIKLADIAVAVTLVVKQWEKAHWNAVMCLYLHSHWEPIRLRNPNALCKCCWMPCIFCSSSYRGACFQFVPLVRHQSPYFDTLSGIFRKCNSANAFWTRYVETVIGWRFRIVQQNAQMSYMAFL